MAFLTEDLIEILKTGVQVNFAKGFELGKESMQWPLICQKIDTKKKKKMTYTDISQIPQMWPWKTERIERNIHQHDIDLSNEPFEDNLRFDKETIEYDQYDQIIPKGKLMGSVAVEFPDYLLAKALSNGTTTLTFDGLPFFSASHHWKGNKAATVQSNLAANTLDIAGIKASLQPMRRYHGGQKDDAGKFRLLRIRTNQFIIIAPSALEETVWELANSQKMTTSNILNPFKGRITPMILPELDDYSTTEWYIAIGHMAAKVGVFQQSGSGIAWDEDKDFDRGEYAIGVSMHCAVGLFNWFLMYKNAP